MEIGALTEYGRLTSVVVKHVRDAFVDERTIAAQWQRLNYTAPPDLARAIDDHKKGDVQGKRYFGQGISL